jgi:serine protease Do
MSRGVDYRRNGRRFGWCVVAALLAAGAGRFPSALGAEDDDTAQAKSLSKAFRNAAHKVIPTVVKIKSITRERRVEGSTGDKSGRNPWQGTPFEDFFGSDEFPPGMRFRGTIPQRMGVGSGVIIDPSGIVLTNGHVLADADEVLVELSDGRELKGSDIKTDEQSDLAILRVKSSRPLPAATFGDSDALEIGDWVIAVGCPFELDSTVSAGIISGKGRMLPSESRASFLQTDAAINPGNSGGPLVDLDGKVIGINTAIASNSGAYEGIGFAIPANLVKWVSGQLIRSGTVHRAYMGVKIGEINGELAEALGVAPGSGVIVSEVLDNSPAVAAGLKEGDIIVSYAGKKVATPQQLQELVERSPAASRQRVEYVREGKKENLLVEVQTLPGKLTLPTALARNRERVKDYGSTVASPELGIKVSDLTPELAKQLGYGGNVSGIVVAGVQPEGVAAPAGIREGMVILRVGSKAVRSTADFKAALQQENLEKGILLLVRTQMGNRFVLLK